MANTNPLAEGGANQSALGIIDYRRRFLVYDG